MTAQARGADHKKSRSGKRLSDLIMQGYFTMQAGAKEGKFVVWVAICVPIEIFKGFDDIIVAVPENHAAMSAGKGAGVPLAQNAENLGFSMDLCSYARIDLGTEFGGTAASPIGGLPRPDLLVSNTNNCSLLVKWFDVYHRELNIPHYILDVPFCYEPQSEKNLHYIMDQFQDLISVVEDMTGQVFDVEKARRALQHSNEALTYWKKFLGFAALRPSPITAFDTFAHMAPYVFMRGEPEVTRHFKLLVRETEQIIEDGDFPVPNERYRLLWDNIAPWHQLRAMRKRLAELDANIVHATYTSCMGTIEGGFEQYPYEGGNPLEYLARIQNFSVCPYGLELRFKVMAAIIENIGIDGIIFASNRSCKVYSIMQMDLQKRICETYGIPAIMIDVDHADVRKYNEEGVFTRVESLLELIDEHRKG
jgi:benzoyl-CoA reductase/2-hydroxyglutaryl-CoA dehydratase subunit BcrC/BadD/HgdB